MDKVAMAINYLKYNRLKTNEHGIHSPFVFELYNHVFKNTSPYYAYSAVEGIRSRLSADKRILHVKDLGAGSGHNQGKARSVQRILKTAVKSPKYSQLLFRLANHFQPDTILELGTSLGISTMYLAIARSKSTVITIEGCPETRQIALENFAGLELSNVRSLEGNFDTQLPELLKTLDTLNFVFFDGNHRKSATISYFEQCLEKVNNESIFIFDDIYWSKEMTEAWEIIKAHPKVKVTIDIFQLGIVFFRKEQVKQHFVLSY
ncbi:MAG: SAM-dependent methyltransferase [Bacteroidetes bacterium]|nr:SAM-dependent methyltransferase [Bacteroidota bacterium]